MTATVRVLRSVPASRFGDAADQRPCTERAGQCAIVVAAAADTQRSSYLPLTISA